MGPALLADSEAPEDFDEASRTQVFHSLGSGIAHVLHSFEWNMYELTAWFPFFPDLSNNLVNVTFDI